MISRVRGVCHGSWSPQWLWGGTSPCSPPPRKSHETQSLNRVWFLISPVVEARNLPVVSSSMEISWDSIFKLLRFAGDGTCVTVPDLPRGWGEEPPRSLFLYKISWDSTFKLLWFLGYGACVTVPDLSRCWGEEPPRGLLFHRDQPSLHTRQTRHTHQGKKK